MIIEFSVGNFRSIKDIQTLSMVAAPISSRHKELDAQNIINTSEKIKLLKTKAVYGANASGKSNLIKAFSVFKNIIANSFRDNTMINKNTIVFSLDEDENWEKPTFMQIVFIIKGIIYRYGFEYSLEGIVSEWLYGKPDQREVFYFLRDKKEVKFNPNKTENLSKTQFLSKSILEDSSLVLSISHFFDSAIFADIFQFMTQKIVVVDGLYSDNALQNVAPLLKNNKMAEKIVNILKVSDTAIDGIEVEEIRNEEESIGSKQFEHRYLDNKNIQRNSEDKKMKFVLWATHKRGKKKEHFNFELLESEGTKKLLELSPFIINAIENSEIFILDEFDSRFHPVISKSIVELFNKNSNNAQFIFATHDTNLLDSKLLRRDQIAFVEKDKYGASHLYDLVEFKGVRNDASFEKDYLDGRYGAIPFIGDFESIFNN